MPAPGTSVRMYDPSGKRYVAGAKLDSNGRARVDGVAPGEYLLKVEAPRVFGELHAGTTEGVNRITPRVTCEAVVRWEGPDPARLSVRDLVSGKQLSTWASMGVIPGFDPGLAAGTRQLPPLPTGAYEYELVSASGETLASGQFSLESGAQNVIDL